MTFINILKTYANIKKDIYLGMERIVMSEELQQYSS